MTKIPDDVVERALSVKTEQCPEGLQYVLIRGLHAIGFQQCSAETWNLLRAAGEVFVAWERERRSLAEATHKKRGTTYDVLADLALLQTDTPLEDMAEVVVYRCRETGDFWVRKHSEFYDGRFDIRDRSAPEKE